MMAAKVAPIKPRQACACNDPTYPKPIWEDDSLPCSWMDELIFLIAILIGIAIIFGVVGGAVWFILTQCPT